MMKEKNQKKWTTPQVIEPDVKLINFNDVLINQK